jgi:hypothetical protein
MLCILLILFTIHAVFVRISRESISVVAAHLDSRGARPVDFHSFSMIVKRSLIIFLTGAMHESQRF